MINLTFIKGGGDSSPEYPHKIKTMRSGRKSAGIVGLCIAIFLVFLLSPIFNITEIRVVGNNALTSDAVIGASGITRGMNIFKLDPAGCEKQISRLAYVDDVKVVRKFPAVVEIRVVESRAHAYFYFIGSYVGIDSTGKILEIRSVDEQLECPVILGTNVTEFCIGNTITIDDEKKMDAVFLILKQIHSDGMQGMIKAVDVADLNDIKIFATSECTAYMGSMDDMIYKVSFLKKILEEPGDKRGAVIDMTKPDKVTYRGS